MSHTIFPFFKDFDNHISKSIPGFDQIDDIILSIFSYKDKSDTRFLDIGSSTCRLINKIKEINDSEFIYGIDPEVEFEKFGSHKISLQDFTETDFDMITSVFSNNFIMTDRTSLYKEIFRKLKSSGVFVCFEKIVEKDGLSQKINQECLFDFKIKSFSPSEIIEKQNKIKNLMIDHDSDYIINKLTESGFKNVHMIWKNLCFAGFVAWKN